ncbi:MAG: TrmH family RNA methyltransferase, partial [Bacteroidota bacterium]
MLEKPFEIRFCESCGLRYPWVEGQPFGSRCPACMGETRAVLRREMRPEPTRPRPQAKSTAKREMAVLLDNIRSAWNVGSILRSADGFDFSHVYLCGITPTPDHEAVTKTSLGAEDTVPWSNHKDAVKLAKGLRKTGRGIYALEENERAVELNQVTS